MRYRAPIVQPGLTRTEANETKARYLRINPEARVSIERQPDNPQMYTLICALPVLPFEQVRSPGFSSYRGWQSE